MTRLSLIARPPSRVIHALEADRIRVVSLLPASAPDRRLMRALTAEEARLEALSRRIQQAMDTERVRLQSLMKP